MISVLTLTYQRHGLLEEAIESFLRQDAPDKTEMVVLNDSKDVRYSCESPGVRIINRPERFSTIGEKLFFGFSQCRYDYIYRLDDDDLLAPGALGRVWRDIEKHPGYDIYRCDGHYLFEHNRFCGIRSNVNNGNLYHKPYLANLPVPQKSFGEDFEITCQGNGRVYESQQKEKSMIYRWGMGTYHLSGMGAIASTDALAQTDRIVSGKDAAGALLPDQGELALHPHFDHDYYSLIG